MSEKIKILIVDDSSFMRNVLARLVEKDGRFEVVGKAKDGKEGVEMVKSLKPDVVTMDIEMPVMTGIEALKIIMQECPLPVVMVSSLTKEGATSTLEAMDYGAVDFIPKGMESGETSVLSNSSILMDKIFAASGAQIMKSSLKPTITRSVSAKPASVVPPVTPVPVKAMPTNAIASKSETAVRRGPARIGLPSAKIMVIGTSTGGPRALQDVIPKLPTKLKVPIIIAQHMPQHFTGPMAERLDSISNIKVVEAKHGDTLQAGTIYIAPGGVHTRIKTTGSVLSVSVREDAGNECVYKPSVSILAQSIAENVGGSTLALMMTGMGSDGSDGFESLKAKGSYILAQDEATSVVYGMPKAVEPIADEVLPLDDIVSAIVRLIG